MTTTKENEMTTKTEKPIKKIATKKDNRQIVRCYGAGVFFATVERRTGKEAILRNARRLWYWAGAASLSQLAVEGTAAPSSCKFPIAVDRIVVTDVIEILDTTEAARTSIDAVPTWKM